ncbi:MAG: 3-oxoacyl-[acyl-carrier-protein] reductase [Mobilitalea sp.]
MLENKIVLVTGAARGIGREITTTLSQYGATVIINYSGSEAAAQDLADSLQKEGKKAYLYRCDVSDFEAVKVMMETIVKEHQRIDILVNNAGITRDNLVLRMKEDEFDDVIRINLKGTFNCMRHVSRAMLKQRGGKIINISSVVGIKGNPGQINYSASKAGVIAMTKTMARELGAKGITVNAVAPGYIDTDMTKELPEEVKKQVLDQIPLRAFGSPTDVAQMVAFLASDKADYITGQVIQIDGGLGI